MKRPDLFLATLLVFGLALRLFLAPYSAGSDITQFYGFAGTMLQHGACFYSYADAVGFSTKGWPYPWPYVYGPVMAYMLAGIRALVGGWVETFWSGGVYHVYVDPTWAFSVKMTFIVADVIVAFFIYSLLKSRGERRAIFGAALYYLNPMVIHVSSIYGMFDGLALLFFLLAIHLERREYLSPLLAGFSLSVKHTLLFPAAVLLWDWLLKGRKGIRRAVLFLAGIALPFVPMLLLCPSSLSAVPKLLRGMNITYPVPVAYSMNGISSLATYLHKTEGLETIALIHNWYIPAAVLLALILLRHAFRRDVIVSTALAYAVFTATYWRVNPQYLLPLAAFLVLLAFPSRTHLPRSVRLLSALTTVYLGLWPILQPTEFWFQVHMKNPNWAVVHIVDVFTLGVHDERIYVGYSLILTTLLYLIVFSATLPYLKNLKAWLSERVRVSA
ncbi:hypothetical protein A3L11_06530 [Thermococcus siculi]|uniref:DUF2029 domain-containing protein n=1 Tax=Thermococcus siculi TaxID=72803 RepID=A0A2Z2MM68_9EURY|nr:hypothetical protein [Thermococcus siculi]ASJ08898.1 hypothetical protein A3L11_06530 [Thermococcus siculi]